MDENSKSEIMAGLNVFFPRLANNDVYIEGDVVSDKVMTFQRTKSSVDVQYSKDLTIEQEVHIQRLVEAFGDILTDVLKKAL